MLKKYTDTQMSAEAWLLKKQAKINKLTRQKRYPQVKDLCLTSCAELVHGMLEYSAKEKANFIRQLLASLATTGKQHMLTDQESLQELYFFAFTYFNYEQNAAAALNTINPVLESMSEQLNSRLISERLFLTMLKYKIELHQLKNCFQEVSATDLSNQSSALKLRCLQSLTQLNKDWLLLTIINRHVLFSCTKCLVGEDLLLMETLDFLLISLQQYISMREQYSFLKEYEHDTTYNVQVRLFKSSVIKLLSEAHAHFFDNTEKLRLLTPANIFTISRLNQLCQQISDGAFAGEKNISDLTLHYAALSPAPPVVDTSKDTSTRRRGMPEQPSNSAVNSPSLAKIKQLLGVTNKNVDVQIINSNPGQVMLSGAHSPIISLVLNEKEILAALNANTQEILLAQEQFQARLQIDAELNPASLWTRKLDGPSVFLYYSNMLALIRHLLNQLKFVQAEATLIMMKSNVRTLDHLDETYMSAFSSFSPKYSLIYEYCCVLCNITNDRDSGEVIINFGQCLMAEYKYKAAYLFVLMGEMAVTIRAHHENNSKSLKMESALKEFSDIIINFHKLMQSGFSDFPFHVISRVELDRMMLIILQKMMNRLLEKTKSVELQTDKHTCVSYALQLTRPLASYNAQESLQPVLRMFNTSYSIALTKFYEQFPRQTCNTQDAWDECYRSLLAFHESAIKSLDTNAELSLYFAEIEYLFFEVLVPDNNFKVKVLVQHLQLINNLISSNDPLLGNQDFKIRYHRFKSLLAHDYENNYPEAMQHAQEALTILGPPGRLNSVLYKEQFLYCSIGAVSSHLAHIVHKIKADIDDDPVEIAREILTLCQRISQHWFFSANMGQFNQRIQAYATTINYNALVSNIVTICLDALTLVNQFATKFPEQESFKTNPAYKNFITMILPIVISLQALLVDEAKRERFFSLGVYSKLARVHMLTWIVCDPAYNALLHISKLQELCGKTIKSAKFFSTQQADVVLLGKYLDDVNLQMNILQSNDFLRVSKNRVSVFAYMDEATHYINESAHELPRKLAEAKVKALQSIEIPKLKAYCEFVYTILMLCHYFSSKTISTFEKKYTALLKDSHLITLPAQDLQFYQLLQPHLVQHYFVHKAYMQMVGRQYHNAHSALSMIGMTEDYRYPYNDLAKFFGTVKLNYTPAMKKVIDCLIKLVCLAQTLNSNHSLKLYENSVKTFIGQGASDSIWEQLPELQSDDADHFTLNTCVLIPFIEHCVSLFFDSCECYLASVSGKVGTIDRELLHAARVKLVTYLEPDRSEKLSSYISRIESINKPKKNKKVKNALVSIVSADEQQHVQDETEPSSAAIHNHIESPQVVTNATPSPIEVTKCVASSAAKARKPTLFVPVPDVAADGFTLQKSKSVKNKATGKHYASDANHQNSSKYRQYATNGKGKGQEIKSKQNTEMHKLNKHEATVGVSTHQAHPHNLAPHVTAIRPIQQNHSDSSVLINQSRRVDLYKTIFATTGKQLSYAAIVRGALSTPSGFLVHNSVTLSIFARPESNVCNSTIMSTHSVQESTLTSAQAAASVLDSTLNPVASSMSMQSSINVAELQQQLLELYKQQYQYADQYNNEVPIYNAHIFELYYHRRSSYLHKNAVTFLGYVLTKSEIPGYHRLQPFNPVPLQKGVAIELNIEDPALNLDVSKIPSRQLLEIPPKPELVSLPDTVAALHAAIENAKKRLQEIFVKRNAILRESKRAWEQLAAEHVTLDMYVRSLECIEFNGTHYIIEYDPAKRTSYLREARVPAPVLVAMPMPVRAPTP